MGWKSTLLKPFAYFTHKKIERMASSAIADQEKWMHLLIKKAKTTRFGKDHDFDSITSYRDFQDHIPLRDYEGLRSYVDMIKKGESDVLWPGKPMYFAKTSGTTSGVKYIPITRESLPNHIETARNALFNFCHKAGLLSVFDGRVIFLSGSPVLEEVGGIPTGRLSGIVNHEIPAWLKGNQLPSYATNCIEDWEDKVEKIVQETKNEDMRLISGIPPWVQMYYELLIKEKGVRSVSEAFNNFNLFVYGGVNYEPYRQKMESLAGRSIPSMELYPASEGFFAFQDEVSNDGLLLNTDSGIFYEFVPLDEVFNEKPARLSLAQVEKNKDYAIIINNNAGLWGYNIGDTVRFVSLDPYKLVVSGRIKHYISAFGEHVIGKEVEEAMKDTCDHFGISAIEFTVAPEVNPGSGLPYHEWFVSFGGDIPDLGEVEAYLDTSMSKQNIYYKDLIEGKILRPLKITALRPTAFRDYMKDQGKLGGQNKVPRLSNDRKIADQLKPYTLSSD
jgi:hypothetical protein